jgi:ADP-ribose pyrophosphatase YjhB (NUDIX family)
MLRDPQWLEWARRLQALARTGLTYSNDHFDIEQYESVYALAAEMIALHGQADVPSVHKLLASEVGHATPKGEVRGVIFRDDSILLVKERQDGLWTLPGGWADVNESPSEAVVREALEESGYQIRAIKLLALYDRRKHAHPPHLHHIYKLFFRCELLGGMPSPWVETESVAFFQESELPELSTMRVTLAQIARFSDHHRHPNWPTDFD